MATLAIAASGGAFLADATQPQIRVEDLGLLRGESVFETLRVIDGGPVDLEGHIRRLGHSAAAVDLPPPDPAALADAAWLAIDAHPERDGVLRLVATKGSPDGVDPVRFALITPLPAGLDEQRSRGIAAITLTLGITATVRPSAPWLLGGVKSTSYAVPMAGARAAHDAGGDDAIWVSSDGEVLEATTSTVLVVSGGVLCSPPDDELGLLPGLTIARVRDVADVTDRRITVAELAAADEILLASSVRGVVPLTSLDGVPREIGEVGATLPAALEARLREIAKAATR